jgi:hypothetical protein
MLSWEPCSPHVPARRTAWSMTDDWLPYPFSAADTDADDVA